jgi:hypothetical protein
VYGSVKVLIHYVLTPCVLLLMQVNFGLSLASIH